MPTVGSLVTKTGILTTTMVSSLFCYVHFIYIYIYIPFSFLLSLSSQCYKWSTGGGYVLKLIYIL